MTWIKGGRLAIGATAPERKKSGNMTKLIINSNPWASRMLEAKESPKALKVTEIKNIKISISKNPKTALNNPNCGAKEKPSKNDAAKKTIPWIIPVVDPPKILPSAIETRETGAIMISFKKPNSLSHRTDMPENIEEKSMFIPIMPGTKKWI